MDQRGELMRAGWVEFGWRTYCEPHSSSTMRLLTVLGATWLRRGLRNSVVRAEAQLPRKSAGTLQTPTTSVSLSPLKPGETLH